MVVCPMFPRKIKRKLKLLPAIIIFILLIFFSIFHNRNLKIRKLEVWCGSNNLHSLIFVRHLKGRGLFTDGYKVNNETKVFSHIGRIPNKKWVPERVIPNPYFDLILKDFSDYPPKIISGRFSGAFQVSDISEIIRLGQVVVSENSNSLYLSGIGLEGSVEILELSSSRKWRYLEFSSLKKEGSELSKTMMVQSVFPSEFYLLFIDNANVLKAFPKNIKSPMLTDKLSGESTFLPNEYSGNWQEVYCVTENKEGISWYYCIRIVESQILTSPICIKSEQFVLFSDVYFFKNEGEDIYLWALSSSGKTDYEIFLFGINNHVPYLIGEKRVENLLWITPEGGAYCLIRERKKLLPKMGAIYQLTLSPSMELKEDILLDLANLF